MTPVRPLLTISDLSVRYPTSSGPVTALQKTNLELSPGETLGLVGESGSGKSTLILSIMGLLSSSAEVSGSVKVDGIEVVQASPSALNRIRGGTVGLVYQDSLAALNPVRPVGVQITEVIQRHLGYTRREAQETAIEGLARVGISDAAIRFRQYPHEFSGGMRQRAAIAMALAARPKLLIADEPTTALDVTVQAQIIDLLKALGDELGMAMLIVSHDLEVIREATQRVAVMYHSRIIELGETGQVLSAPRHPYTRALVRSAPSVSRPIISFIPGTPPGAHERIEGCSYEARCDVGKGLEVCRCQRPDLVKSGCSWAACHFPLEGMPMSKAASHC